MIRKYWIMAAVAFSFSSEVPAAIAQNGPPSSGSSAAIQFTPATVNLVAGLNGHGNSGNGGLATAAQFSYPVGISYDSHGNIFIADENNYVVRRIDHATGDIGIFAGTNGMSGFSAGGGVATNAQLGTVSGLAVDSSDNVYVADRGNSVVWKITPGGAISVYAGGGSGGLGDGGPATSAQLNNPWALGIDAKNNIYIADSYNDLIRKVDHSTGVITTFAGDVADAGSDGSCNPSLYSTSSPPYTATDAHLCFPEGIAFDAAGNAYIADTTRNIVRKVDSNGIISTFAGAGARAYGGDGGPAIAAELNEPAGLYVDPGGRLYISDFFNGRIRVVDSTGNINTVFGNGFGNLSKASLGEPDTENLSGIGPADGIYDFMLDPFGNIVASDSSGNAVTSAGSIGQYVFPKQQIYQTSSPYLMVVSNPSGVTLNFTGTPTVTGPFAISGGTCELPGSLASGASCTIGITFTPTGDQKYTASIVLLSNANSSPSTIELSGTGTGAVFPSATLTPSQLTFASPAGVTSAAQTATLTNTGVVPLQVDTASTSFTGASAANFALATPTGTDCPASLGANDSCHFNVTFTPTAATTYLAGLQVVVTNYGDLHTSLSGTGTGQTAPIVSLTPASLSFTSTSGVTTAAQTATLKNAGNGPLDINAIAIAGVNPSVFAQTNNCSDGLNAGASCTISVTFTPSSATSFSATLTVTDNAAGSPHTVALSGTGTSPPDFTVSATPAAQTVQPGGSAAYTVTVQSTNGSFAGTVALSASGLPAGASATFSPAKVSPSDGSATSTLTVQTATAGPLTASRGPGSSWPFAVPGLALVFLLPVRRWRKLLAGKALALVLGLTALATAAAITGCGGGFALTPQAQTYTLTITGASGTDTHSTTVQLTVQ